MRLLPALCVLALATPGCPKPPPKPPAAVLPAGTVQDEGGKPVDLKAITAGKVVVLDLWATWCPPCVENIPRLVRLAEASQGTDLLIIGLDVGEEDFSKVVRFGKDLQVNYPLYFDPSFAYADQLGSSKVPTVLVLDRSGNVVHRSSELDEDTLRIVERTLAK